MMEKINVVIGLPKSFFFNIKVFGWKKGVKLPILLGPRCRYNGVNRGSIKIKKNAKFGQIKIGINYGPFDKGIKDSTIIKIGKNACLSFNGECNISSGSILNVSAGVCIFGERFAANANFLLSCEKSIIFGNDVLFGWSCTVIDGDGHSIINVENDTVINEPKEIKIENHVWVSACSTILKGTYISKDSIVGYGSIVTGKFKTSGNILAGGPAKLISENRNWIR